MIKKVMDDDLSFCLEVFHRGYETVATEFGLTEENCPYRGRASLPLDALISEYENGTLMFGYFLENKVIGFLGIDIDGNNVCKLNDIIVLPEYRDKGYGIELLNYCKIKAVELGANKIILGMIDDNKRLKNWYIKNGFINVGYKKYAKAPFTVGIMEQLLQ